MALVQVPNYLLSAGGIVNSVYAENATADIAAAAVTGTYPALTGGTLITSIAITPTKATSILELQAVISALGLAMDLRGIAWIKESGGTNAIASVRLPNGNGAIISNLSFTLAPNRRIVAGSTTARTYELYAGYDSAVSFSSFVVNPSGGEATLKVTEYQV